MGQKRTELALGILKPDALARNLRQEIFTQIEANGLKIRTLGVRKLSEREVEFLYSHHKNDLIFPKVKNFMVSQEVEIFLIEGENVSSKMDVIKRAIRTQYRAAHSIYSQFPPGVEENLIHASGNEEELRHFLRT